MWSDKVGLALQGSDVLVLSQRSLTLSWETHTVCTKATSMLTLLGDFSKAKCSVSQTVTFCKALDMILCFLLRLWRRYVSFLSASVYQLNALFRI